MHPKQTEGREAGSLHATFFDLEAATRSLLPPTRIYVPFLAFCFSCTRFSSLFASLFLLVSLLLFSHNLALSHFLFLISVLPFFLNIYQTYNNREAVSHRICQSHSTLALFQYQKLVWHAVFRLAEGPEAFVSTARPESAVRLRI